jgi:hypothetical protein
VDYQAITETGGITKPEKKKDYLDMRSFSMGKTSRSQRIDKRARKVDPEEANCICWIPGCTKKTQQAKHHVLQVWDKIIDHKFNCFRACNDHHPECDEGKISQIDQFAIIAEIYNTTIEDIIKTLEDFSGLKLFIEGESVKTAKPIMQRQMG